MSSKDTDKLSTVESEQDLIHLQRTFADIIRRPLLGDDKMSEDERSDVLIQKSPTLSPHERLELYSQQYWWRLLGSLSDDFKIVKKILGAERFRKLCEAYLDKHKSSSFTLRHLGSRFVKFLNDNPNLYQDYPICLDVAKIEWAQMEVAFVGDKPPIREGDLKGDPSKLHLGVQPSVQLLRLKYPAHTLIEAKEFKQKAATQQTSNTMLTAVRSSQDVSNEDLIIPELEDSYLVVHRYQYGIYFKELSLYEFTVLEALRNEGELERSCEKLFELENGSQYQEKLQLWFHDWVNLGWLYVTRPD